MGEEEDYAEGPRPTHEPTLAERARTAPDPADGSAAPARRRVPASAVVAFTLVGVFVGTWHRLAEVARIERLGRPWSLVVYVVALFAVCYPLAEFGRRRLLVS